MEDEDVTSEEEATELCQKILLQCGAVVQPLLMENPINTLLASPVNFMEGFEVDVLRDGTHGNDMKNTLLVPGACFTAFFTRTFVDVPVFDALMVSGETRQCQVVKEKGTGTSTSAEDSTTRDETETVVPQLRRSPVPKPNPNLNSNPSPHSPSHSHLHPKLIPN